jgi:hypothetical protein
MKVEQLDVTEIQAPTPMLGLGSGSFLRSSFCDLHGELGVRVGQPAASVLKINRFVPLITCVISGNLRSLAKTFPVHQG